MKIQTKFSFYVGIVFFLVLVLLLMFSYRQARLDAERNAYATCKKLVSAVAASRSYVREVLRPVMFELLGKDQFIPEAMSGSFVTRKQFDFLLSEYPDYLMKFASKNPRNPASKADSIELSIIKNFTKDPTLKIWEGITRKNNIDYMTVAKPFRFKKMCLRCHGDPADAPQSMIEKYGDKNGFWANEGEVTIYSVGVPIKVTFEGVGRKVLFAILPIMGLLIIVYFMINVLFRETVSLPVDMLTEGVRRITTGDYSTHVLLQGSKEFEELAGAFNNLVDELSASKIKRRNAEKSLKESEQKFRAMADTSPLAIYMSVGIEQKAEYINQTFINFFGYTLEDVPMVEKWWPLAYPDDDYREQVKNEWQKRVEKAIATKSDIEPMEVVVTCKDGSKKNISWGFINIGEQSWAFGLNLTQQKKAEEALKESEKRLRTILENSRDLLYQFNLQTGTYDYISPSLETLVGISPDDYIAGGIELDISLLHPDDRAKLKNHIDHLLSKKLKEGMSPTLEYRFKHPKLGYRWFSDNRTIIYDEDENALGVVGNSRDITESVEDKDKLNWELRVNKVLAELANILIDQNQSIQMIVEKVYACAKELTNSEHGYVSEIDRVANENVGYTLTNMMGETCKLTGPDQRIAFPCGDDGIYPKLWEHSLNTGESFFSNTPESHPCFTKLPEGHVPLKSFLSVPVKYGGKIVGQIALANSQDDYSNKHIEAIERIGDLYALAIYRSRTSEDNTKMERRLQQAQKMEAIGTLAGGIAHDFNNILSPILGYADIVQEQLPQKSELWNNQQAIIDAGYRAKDLVQQILSFSRQAEHERQPLQIHLIVKEALKLLRASIPTTIEIRENIVATAGVVLADPSQIHQVIMNLCTNAYHAMQKTGGILGVSLTAIEIGQDDDEVTGLEVSPGRYLVLEVSDTGHGMNKAILDRIFEPYFTTKEKGKGTGLGLAMVHGIVKSHGGHITVYSESGKGTNVHVYLPHVLSEVSAPRPEQKKVLPQGNERVLLVDDEETIVHMERQMLESLGYSVTVLTNSAEAWNLLRKQPESFDLVITDMTMPNLTGVELAKRYMAIRPDAPVILCTGFSELVNEEKTKAIGIRQLIMKPVIKRDLAKAVREVLDGA